MSNEEDNRSSSILRPSSPSSSYYQVCCCLLYCVALFRGFDLFDQRVDQFVADRLADVVVNALRRVEHLFFDRVGEFDDLGVVLLENVETVLGALVRLLAGVENGLSRALVDDLLLSGAWPPLSA